MTHSLLVIADAHPNMLEAVRRLLGDLFEAVVMVADGDSLLRVSAALRPDLIIVDLSLPFSGTGNVLRHLCLRTSLPHAKVIVLSIHDEAEAVRETFATGAMGFVLKRAAATDLLPAVSDVLRGQRYVSPGVESGDRVFDGDDANHMVCGENR
jgi:DNA-binding NarL/FixJ family response regulator